MFFFMGDLANYVSTHLRFGPLGATNGRPMPTIPQNTVKMMTGTIPILVAAERRGCES